MKSIQSIKKSKDKSKDITKEDVEDPAKEIEKDAAKATTADATEDSEEEYQTPELMDARVEELTKSIFRLKQEIAMLQRRL